MNTDELKELKRHIYGTYLESPRDRKLRNMLQGMVDNVDDHLNGGGGSRQTALFVIGESGSGKSHSLKHHCGRIAEFQPRENEFGETITPFLSIEASSSSTMKGFAITLLSAMGLPANSKQTETQLFSAVKTQLKARGILYLHVDEAQHLIRHDSQKVITEVQDGLKSLMQIPDWPLHTIFSGVPDLAKLLTNDLQLANRSKVIRYVEQSPTDDQQFINDAMTKIAEQMCGLKIADELREADFVGRLCHSAQGGLGKIVETIRAACILTVKNDRTALENRAFAFVYQESSGCLPEHNIFSAARWSEISPEHVLADLSASNEPKKKGRTKK